MTPLPASAGSSFATAPTLLGKRGSESEGDGYAASSMGGREVQEPVKKRRIAPTLVGSAGPADAVPEQASASTEPEGQSK